MSYRIKSVAALTGISTTTLRAWERRYDVVTPRRTESGYRVYSEADIAMLTRVKALVDKGFRAGEAIALVRRRGAEPPPVNPGQNELRAIRTELMTALLELDRARAVAQYSRFSAIPFDQQIDDVLLPLLRRVGKKWEHGESTVAQEHFCSVFVRERLVGMLDALNSGPAEGREVVCAGAPGELHEFGLLGAAVHLAMRGWRVTYLGADLPVEDLRSVLGPRRPAMLCTSLVQPRPRAECVALAQALRASSPSETTVVIGGSGIAEGLPRIPCPGVHFLREYGELFRIQPVLVA